MNHDSGPEWLIIKYSLGMCFVIATGLFLVKVVALFVSAGGNLLHYLGGFL